MIPWEHSQASYLAGNGKPMPAMRKAAAEKPLFLVYAIAMAENQVDLWHVLRFLLGCSSFLMLPLKFFYYFLEL